MKTFNGPFLIVGMGASGQAAIHLLKATGVSDNQIFTFDDKGPAQFQSPDVSLQTSRAKTIVVSPGYPLSTPWIQSAANNGIQITSELSLAIAYLQEEIKIGITGSVGKSTTSAILQEGARQVDPFSFLGGNFGIPLAEYTAQVIEGRRKRAKYLILELSSYQLENARGLNLDYSIVTSLTENHLERYKLIDAYYLSKLSIIDRTSKGIVFNENGLDLFEYIKKIVHFVPDRGSAVKAGGMSFRDKQDADLLKISGFEKVEQLLEMRQMIASALKDRDEASVIHWTSSRIGEQSEIIGKHNKDNLALAIRMAQLLGLDASAMDRMRKFKGLSHRLENLGWVRDVRFINDSKSTTIESVKVALEACRDFSRPSTVYVLLGGRDKNLPWEKLSSYKGSGNFEFVFFGECADTASKKSQLSTNTHSSLGSALTWTFTRARKGDTVLLSPGGTSLDEFKNFEERGNFFKEKVKSF